MDPSPNNTLDTKFKLKNNVMADIGRNMKVQFLSREFKLIRLTNLRKDEDRSSFPSIAQPIKSVENTRLDNSAKVMLSGNS